MISTFIHEGFHALYNKENSRDQELMCKIVSLGENYASLQDREFRDIINGINESKVYSPLGWELGEPHGKQYYISIIDAILNKKW